MQIVQHWIPSPASGFTKTAALEVARSGVTVNAICPGYVLTDLVKNQLADTARARGIPVEEVRWGRRGAGRQCMDVAPHCCWLFGPGRVARYIA